MLTCRGDWLSREPGLSASLIKWVIRLCFAHVLPLQLVEAEKTEHVGDSFCSRLSPGPTRSWPRRGRRAGRRELGKFLQSSSLPRLPSQELRSDLQTPSHRPLHCILHEVYVGSSRVEMNSQNSSVSELGGSLGVSRLCSPTLSANKLLLSVPGSLTPASCWTRTAPGPIFMAREQPLDHRDHVRAWWV